MLGSGTPDAGPASGICYLARQTLPEMHEMPRIAGISAPHASTRAGRNVVDLLGGAVVEGAAGGAAAGGDAGAGNCDDGGGADGGRRRGGGQGVRGVTAMLLEPGSNGWRQSWRCAGLHFRAVRDGGRAAIAGGRERGSSVWGFKDHGVIGLYLHSIICL